MKITIDTNEDNPEHIKQLCHFLLDFANNNSSSSSYSNSQPSSSSTDTTSMMDMFDDPQPSNTPPLSERAPDFGAFLNLTKGHEKKDPSTKPQIEFL